MQLHKSMVYFANDIPNLCRFVFFPLLWQIVDNVAITTDYINYNTISVNDS